MFVCKPVHIHASMHVCLCACMYMYVHVSMYVSLHVHVCRYMCMCMCFEICMYVCIYVCMYVYVSLCMYVCLYVVVCLCYFNMVIYFFSSPCTKASFGIPDMAVGGIFFPFLKVAVISLSLPFPSCKSVPSTIYFSAHGCILLSVKITKLKRERTFAAPPR